MRKRTVSYVVLWLPITKIILPDLSFHTQFSPKSLSTWLTVIWSCFHTCTATLNLSGHYPEELSVNRTLNGLYPASSLVQSLCNVRLSPRVNRTGLLMRFISCKWHKTRRIQKSKGHEEGSISILMNTYILLSTLLIILLICPNTCSTDKNTKTVIIMEE